MRRQATPAWCARTVSAAWSWRWFRRFEPGGAYVVEITFWAPHAIDAPLPLRLLDFHTGRRDARLDARAPDPRLDDVRVVAVEARGADERAVAVRHVQALGAQVLEHQGVHPPLRRPHGTFAHEAQGADDVKYLRQGRGPHDAVAAVEPVLCGTDRYV